MSTQTCDHLIRHANLATFASIEPSRLIEDGALVIVDGRIVWLGPDRELASGIRAERETDCGGHLLTPGLIDCHTHLVWGGDRTREFEMRLEGVSYAEIARAGGGIRSTVRATRAASEEELLDTARRRLRELVSEGVTSVEIKSGYGLDTATELKTLRVARRLKEEGEARIHATFLGAHAVPPEFEGRADAYLDLVIEEMLPAVVEAGLAEAVDAFCENIAFSPEEVERLFKAAKEHGLHVKLHAEQLTNSGGSALAARYGALSADHLEYLDEAGVKAMAEAGTVAVLLPGAFYFLNEKQAPPVDLLRAHGVPIAVATDLNPGSSPVHSLLSALNLSCVLWGLTPTEALAGATLHAARALGLEDRGSLAVGQRADFALWDAQRPVELVARLGGQLCRGRFLAGERCDHPSPGQA